VRSIPVLLLLVSSLILIAVSPVAAECQTECSGCRDTIQVIPVGSTKTGEPIVTENPADLVIFHTGNGPIKNVWLLIVLSEDTYDALDQIVIDDTVFMPKMIFNL
jgi:hypothetical protein